MKNVPYPMEFYLVHDCFYMVAVYLHVPTSPKNTGPQKDLSFLLPFAEQGLNFFFCSLATTFETSVVGLGDGSIAHLPMLRELWRIFLNADIGQFCLEGRDCTPG